MDRHRIDVKSQKEFYMKWISILLFFFMLFGCSANIKKNIKASENLDEVFVTETDIVDVKESAGRKTVTKEKRVKYGVKSSNSDKEILADITVGIAPKIVTPPRKTEPCDTIEILRPTKFDGDVKHILEAKDFTVFLNVKTHHFGDTLFHIAEIDSYYLKLSDPAPIVEPPESESVLDRLLYIVITGLVAALLYGLFVSLRRLRG